MRSRWIVLALVTVLATTLSAHRQRTTKSRGALLAVQYAAGAGGSVSITFVQIGAALTQPGSNQGTIELGEVSYYGGSSQPGVTTRALPGVLQVSTDFGIRADRQGTAAKTATISAFVLSGSPPYSVSIDGILLGASAQVISSSADFGIMIPHTLSVGVPTTSPEGPLSVTVGVMAVTN